MNPAAPSLAQLRDIHLPPAIGGWPPAPGWWLLALLLLMVLAAGGLWLWRRHRRNRYRREALELLAGYVARYQRDNDRTALLAALSTLLRRTALTAYPHQAVAGLSGDAWRDFLREHSGLDALDSPLGDALVHGPYRPQADTDMDVNALLELAKGWIKQHRRAPC